MLKALVICLILVLSSYCARLSSSPYGRQLDTRLAKLSQDQQLPFLRTELQTCAIALLQNDSKETLQRLESLLHRIPKRIKQVEELEEFNSIARQIRACGLAVFLTIVYESDRNGFPGSSAAKWCGIDAFDLVFLALLKQQKWSQFAFTVLPNIDLIDAVLRKGWYMLEEDFIMAQVYQIYISKIVHLMTIFMPLDDGSIGTLFHYKAKEIVQAQIEVSREHLVKFFIYSDGRREQPERDLLVSLHPLGHIGMLTDVFDGFGVRVLRHYHLHGLSLQDTIKLSRLLKSPEDRQFLKQSYSLLRKEQS